MPEPYRTIALLLLGGCVGSLISHWLAKDRERHRDRDKEGRDAAAAKETARRDFRISITNLRGDFIDAKADELFDKYSRSRRMVESDCEKVQSSISDVAGLGEIRDAYLALTESDIQCPDNDAKRPKPYDGQGNYSPGRSLDWTTPNRPELGRAKIKKILDAMIDGAK